MNVFNYNLLTVEVEHTSFKWLVISHYNVGFYVTWLLEKHILQVL